MSKGRVIYNLFDKSKDCLVASRASLADNFFSRLKGLMFRRTMDREEALVFYRTASIHTFFMRFPLDLVFLDKKMRIIKVFKGLKPGRIAVCLAAYVAVELPGGRIAQKGLEIGDVLGLAPIILTE
jgi:hypothetical protein